VPDRERLAGSTGTVALLRRDRCVVANVGDSRAVLCRASGAAVDLSPDHRPSGRAVAAQAEIARVAATGAWVADGRVMGVLAVSRAFGDWEFKEGRKEFLDGGAAQGLWAATAAEGRTLTSPPVIATPDVNEIALEEGDQFVLIASDGLWDYTSSAQAVLFVRGELARNGGDARAAAEALVGHAVRRRRSKDNVAAVVVSLRA
jgi:serine/threonine protein phosphatase PrpC